MSYHLWTPAEEALLVEHYSTMTNAALAQMMGMPFNAVARKAARMGLRKSEEWNVTTKRGKQPEHYTPAAHAHRCMQRMLLHAHDPFGLTPANQQPRQPA